MRVRATWSLVCVLFILFPTMRLVAKPALATESQQGDPRAAADLKTDDSDFARGLARAIQEGRFDLRPTAADGVTPHLTDAAVRVLFTSTRHASPAVRRLAAWALGEARVMNATAPLLGLLRDDPDAGVRAQAAQSLGDIAAPDAVAGLGGALTDDTDDVRQRAAHALGDVGVPEIVEALEPALTDNSSSVRGAAEWAVRQAAEKAPDGTLLNWLRHRHPEVRLHAAHVLGDRRLLAATDALRGRLGDEDTRVRQKAAWALREIRNR